MRNELIYIIYLARVNYLEKSVTRGETHPGGDTIGTSMSKIAGTKFIRLGYAAIVPKIYAF